MEHSFDAPVTTAALSSVPAGTLLPPDSSALASPVEASVPPVKKPRRRWPSKPPKDSRVRKAVVAYISLRAQGFNLAEISEELGLTKQTIQTYVKRANAAGWINFHSHTDEVDRIEYVLKSKAVQNLNTVLNETTDDGALTERAVHVALEVAKGTGLLKQHQVVKSDGPTQVGVALKVQVEMPPNAAAPVIRTGSIGGQPAFDAEIIDQ